MIPPDSSFKMKIFFKIIKYNNDDCVFFDNIRLNLLPDENLNFIGNINNIRKNYLDGYYVKVKLLSYEIYLGKDKESKPTKE